MHNTCNVLFCVYTRAPIGELVWQDFEKNEGNNEADFKVDCKVD
jgi:hypothetical protein